MAAFDDGERVGFLDVRQLDTPHYTDEHSDAAHMLSEASDLETATIADLSALRTHLILRKEREELLHAALILLNADRSPSLREQAAKALSMHRDPGEWPWVEGVLMSAPLPESADALGATRWPHPRGLFATACFGTSCVARRHHPVVRSRRRLHRTRLF